MIYFLCVLKCNIKSGSTEKITLVVSSESGHLTWNWMCFGFKQATVFCQRPTGLHQTTASSTARKDRRCSQDRRGKRLLMTYCSAKAETSLIILFILNTSNMSSLSKQNKIKVVALKITNNINILIKVRTLKREQAQNRNVSFLNNGHRFNFVLNKI